MQNFWIINQKYGNRIDAYIQAKNEKAAAFSYLADRADYDEIFNLKRINNGMYLVGNQGTVLHVIKEECLQCG